MVNYQNGKIYTIRCRSDENLIYVGSTSQTLSQRMTQHRSRCKRGDGCSLYDYIVNDDWSDFYIELYEMYPCNQKCELEKREGEVIREIGTINKCIAGRTRKEYYEDNAEKLKEKNKEYNKKNAEYFKEYYEENAEKIKEYNKEHYEKNIDKYKKYYEDNAEKIKKYYGENIDKIKKYHKEYYEDNKEKRKEKVCCDICGVFIRKDGLTAHQKRKNCTDEKNEN